MKLPNLAWVLNAWSKAAGYARALITVLSSVLVFLTANGPIDNPVVAKISAALIAAIQILTRFTGLGNKPPTVAPNAPAAPAVGDVIQP